MKNKYVVLTITSATYETEKAAIQHAKDVLTDKEDTVYVAKLVSEVKTEAKVTML